MGRRPEEAIEATRVASDLRRRILEAISSGRADSFSVSRSEIAWIFNLSQDSLTAMQENLMNIVIGMQDNEFLISTVKTRGGSSEVAKVLTEKTAVNSLLKGWYRDLYKCRQAWNQPESISEACEIYRESALLLGVDPDFKEDMPTILDDVEDHTGRFQLAWIYMREKVNKIEEAQHVLDQGELDPDSAFSYLQGLWSIMRAGGFAAYSDLNKDGFSPNNCLSSSAVTGHFAT